MANEVRVPIRLEVLKDSVNDLQGILEHLKPDSSSFKHIAKYLQQMNDEMTRFQALTNSAFSDQAAFNKAGKSIDKMQESLNKANVAIGDLKFSDIKLDASQLKSFQAVEAQIKAIKEEFAGIKEQAKQSLLSDNATKDLIGNLNPSYLKKDFDALSKAIDSEVSKLETKLINAQNKLNDALNKKQSKADEINRLTTYGISKEGLGEEVFNRFFQQSKAGLLSFNSRDFKKGEAKQEFLNYLAKQFTLTKADMDSIQAAVKSGSARSFDELFKNMGKSITGNVFTKRLDSNTFGDLNGLRNAVAEAEKAQQELAAVQQKFNDIQGDSGAVGIAAEKYQASLDKLNEELLKLQNNAVNAAQALPQVAKGSSGATSELTQLQSALSQANAKFLTLQRTTQNFNQIKMAIVNFMGFRQTLNLVKNAISGALNHIKELDSVMNKISIVTDMSTGDLWNQVDAYSKMAQTYGVSIKGAYEVSQIYYQQGLKTNDVLTLTNETLKLAKISGLDYAQTTDYMTTALRGFKLEMSDASKIVDVYSNLAAHTAVSQEELAIAMSKTASSMESVGSTFEETSAMIGTMVAVTRESSTNIGTALKSIASRYGEMKKDMSAVVDAEGEAISYNKVDAALQSIGISMKTADGQFREFTDVIIELGEKWNELDSVQQRYIATQFAGNRQQSRFLALVSNVDLLKQNIAVAEDSEDTGTLQALKALDSVESKLEQLKVSYQQFYTTVGGETIWKGLLDGARGFVDYLNGLPKLFGKIPVSAIAVIANALGLIKMLAFKVIGEIADVWLERTQKAGENTGDEMGESMSESVRRQADKMHEAGRELGRAASKGFQEGAAEGANQATSTLINAAVNKGGDVGATVAQQQAQKQTPTTSSVDSQIATQDAMKSTVKDWFSGTFSDVDLDSGKDAIVASVTTAAANASTDLKPALSGVGLDVSVSIAQGILQSMGMTADAAKELSTTILDTIRSTLNIHSPSPTVIAMLKTGIGGAAVQALAETGADAGESAESFGERLMQALADSIKNGETNIKNLISALGDDFDELFKELSPHLTLTLRDDGLTEEQYKTFQERYEKNKAQFNETTRPINARGKQVEAEIQQLEEEAEALRQEKIREARAAHNSARAQHYESGMQDFNSLLPEEKYIQLQDLKNEKAELLRQKHDAANLARSIRDQIQAEERATIQANSELISKQAELQSKAATQVTENKIPTTIKDNIQPAVEQAADVDNQIAKWERLLQLRQEIQAAGHKSSMKDQVAEWKAERDALVAELGVSKSIPTKDIQDIISGKVPLPAQQMSLDMTTGPLQQTTIAANEAKEAIQELTAAEKEEAAVTPTSSDADVYKETAAAAEGVVESLKGLTAEERAYFLKPSSERDPNLGKWFADVRALQAEGAKASTEGIIGPSRDFAQTLSRYNSTLTIPGTFAQQPPLMGFAGTNILSGAVKIPVGQTITEQLVAAIQKSLDSGEIDGNQLIHTLNDSLLALAKGAVQAQYEVRPGNKYDQIYADGKRESYIGNAAWARDLTSRLTIPEDTDIRHKRYAIEQGYERRLSNLQKEAKGAPILQYKLDSLNDWRDRELGMLDPDKAYGLIADETAKHEANTEAIKQETEAVQELNAAKQEAAGGGSGNPPLTLDPSLDVVGHLESGRPVAPELGTSLNEIISLNTGDVLGKEEVVQLLNELQNVGVIAEDTKAKLLELYETRPTEEFIDAYSLATATNGSIADANAPIELTSSNYRAVNQLEFNLDNLGPDNLLLAPVKLDTEEAIEQASIAREEIEGQLTFDDIKVEVKPEVKPEAVEEAVDQATPKKPLTVKEARANLEAAKQAYANKQDYTYDSESDKYIPNQAENGMAYSPEEYAAKLKELKAAAEQAKVALDEALLADRPTQVANAQALIDKLVETEAITPEIGASLTASMNSKSTEELIQFQKELQEQLRQTGNTGQEAGNKVDEGMKKANKNSGQMWSAIGMGITTLSSTLGGLVGQTTELGGAISSLGTIAGGASRIIGGIMSHSPMGWIMGITTAITGIISFFQNFSLEKQIERAEKKFEELNNKAKEIKANFKILDKGIDKYNELAKKRYESEDAEEEYQAHVDELTSKFPELLLGFDSAGNAIMDTKNMEDVLAAAREDSAAATLEAVRAERESAKLKAQQATQNLDEELGKIKFSSDDFETNRNAEAISVAQEDKSWWDSGHGVVRLAQLAGVENIEKELEYNNAAGTMARILEKSQEGGLTGSTDDQDLLHLVESELFTSAYSETEGFSLEKLRKNLQDKKDAYWAAEDKTDLSYLTVAEDNMLNYLNVLLGTPEQLMDNINAEIESHTADLETISDTDLRNFLTEENTFETDVDAMNGILAKMREASQEGDTEALNKYYTWLKEFIGSLPSNSDILKYAQGQLEAIDKQLAPVIRQFNAAQTSKQAATRKEISATLNSGNYLSNETRDSASMMGLLTEYLEAGIGDNEDVTQYLDKNEDIISQLDNYWISLSSKYNDEGENLQEKLTSMLEDGEHYSAEDIIRELELPKDDEIAQIFTTIFGKSDKYDSVIKNISEKYKDKNLDNTNLNELVAQIDNYHNEQGHVLTSIDRAFYSTIANRMEELEKAGQGTKSDILLAATDTLRTELDKLDEETRNIILDSLKENGIATKEAIAKTKQKAKSVGVKDNDAVYKALETLETTTSMNIQLSMQALTDNLTSNWSDSSKNLKKLTSGIDFTEMQDILDEAETFGGDFTLTRDDFIQNGDKLVLTAEKASEYWKAFIEYNRAQAKEYEDAFIDAERVVSNSVVNQAGIGEAQLYSTLKSQQGFDAISTIMGDELENYLVRDKDTGEILNYTNLAELRERLFKKIEEDRDSIDKYKDYLDWADKQIDKAHQWDTGNYSSLMSDMGANYATRLAELARGAQYTTPELNAPDVKNAVDKIQSAYGSFISDLIEKGADKINLDAYKGIFNTDIEAIKGLLASGSTEEIIRTYAMNAGKTLEEVDGLLSQYVSKTTSKYTGIIEELMSYTGGEITEVTREALGLDADTQVVSMNAAFVISKAKEFLQTLAEQIGKAGYKLSDYNATAKSILDKTLFNQGGNSKALLDFASGDIGADALETLANNFGLQLDQLVNVETGQVLGVIGNRLSYNVASGNYEIQGTFDGFIAALENQFGITIDRTSKQYIESFKAFNDAKITKEHEIDKAVTEELKGIVSLKPGESLNIAQTFTTLSSTMTGLFEMSDFKAALKEMGANLVDGILTIEQGADIQGIIQAIAQKAAEAGALLPEELDELNDALVQVLRDITNIISSGIGGSISGEQMRSLTKWAADYGVTDLQFIETAEGYQLATESAKELYHTINAINSLQGQVVFEKLKDNLIETDERFKSSQSNAAYIAELEDKIAKANKSSDARINQYKEELALAQKIAEARGLTEDNSFKFMDQDIPSGQKNPLNYFESWNKAYQAMKATTTGGKSQKGKMAYQDFYNLITEMGNLEKITGKSIQIGKNVKVNSENVASLIEQAAGALEVQSDGSLKVNLSKIGVDFAAGADAMNTNVAGGIKEVAASQVQMLDQLIGLLETIVTMEDAFKQFNVDADMDMELDFDEIFKVKKGDDGSIQEVLGFADNWQNALEYLRKKLDPKDKENYSEDFARGAESIQFAINGFQMSLAQLLNTNFADLSKYGFTEENFNVYQAIMKGVYDAIQSGDYSELNVKELIMEKLSKSLGEGGKVTFDMGNYTFIGTSKGSIEINWDQESVKQAVKKHTKEVVQTALTATKEGKATPTQLEIALEAKGLVTYNTDNEAQVKIGDKTYTKDNTQQWKDALGAKLLESEGAKNITFSNEEDYTATGTITMGNTIVTVAATESGKIEYYSEKTTGYYDSMTDLIDAEVDYELNKNTEYSTLSDEAKEAKRVELKYQAEVKAGIASFELNSQSYANLDSEIREKLEEAIASGDRSKVDAVIDANIELGSLKGLSTAEMEEKIGIKEIPIKINGDVEEANNKLDELQKKVKDITDPTYTIDINLSPTVVATYATLSSINQQLASIAANKTQTIDITKNITTNESTNSGTSSSTNSPSRMTGNQKGTATGNIAMAQGTLMGELGQELVVSNGRYFVVGQNGPEFVNLADDAIVFNHLQTEQLLKHGMSNTRGKAVTSEQNAVAFAKGNLAGGPALASARAVLAQLKQLRAMWKSLGNTSAQDLAGLGGSGGGGGGGDKNDPARKAWIETVERWYDLMQEIAKLEKEITHQEALRTKLSSDWQKNGAAYYQSQKKTLQDIEKQMIAQEQLNISKRDYFNQRRNQLNEYGAFKDWYKFDEQGQLKYNDGALAFLSDLTARDANNVPKYSLEEQYNMLIAQGYGAQMQYTSSGEEIQRPEAKEGETPDYSDFYSTSIQAVWDQVEAEKQEMQSLYDTIAEGEDKMLELEADRNEILEEIRNNQIEVENSVLKAFVNERQELIDNLSDERKALEESTNKYISGLTDALNKEKEMYQTQQDEEELNRKRRQLAILQRSGGSASQIDSLQRDIRSAEQEQYFNYQQQQIDKIQEASDLEIERLDTQINIMTESLEYQKENGLLWNEVYDYMYNHSAYDIAAFIQEHDQERWGASPLETEKQIQEELFKAQQWEAFQQDQAAYNDYMQSENGYQQTVADAVYGDTSHSDWNVFNTAMTKLYGDQWKAIAGTYQNKFFKDYSSTGDITQATTSLTSSLSNLGSQLTSSIGGAFNSLKAEIAEAKAQNSGGGGSGNGNGNSEGKTNPEKTPATSPSNNNSNNGHGYTVFVTLKGSDGKTYSGSANNAVYDTAYNWAYRAASEKIPYGVTITNKSASYERYLKGGLADYTGPAWIDGTKSNPEAVLNAHQTKVLRDDILSNKPTSLMNLLLDFKDAYEGMGSNYSTINNDSGIIIENATVEMHIDQISNDYDARRAGEQALSEMMRIARKTSAKNSVGR